MHYFAIVMVEDSERLPPEQRAEGHQVLAAGGLPLPQASCGPWRTEQRAAVQAGVERFLTHGHGHPYRSGNSLLAPVFPSADEWVATFHFDTGSAEDLQSVRQRAERLHRCLTTAVADQGLTVTLYESF